MTNDSNNRAGLPQFVHDKLSSCFGGPEELFFEDPKPTIVDIGDDEDDDDVDAGRGNDFDEVAKQGYARTSSSGKC